MVEEQELDITKLNSLKVDQGTISGQLAQKLKKMKESSIFIQPFEAVKEDNIEDDEFEIDSEEYNHDMMKSYAINNKSHKEETKRMKKIVKTSTFWMQK